METITTAALVAGIPALPALFGIALGILKDGSPLRRTWWTS